MQTDPVQDTQMRTWIHGLMFSNFLHDKKKKNNSVGISIAASDSGTPKMQIRMQVRLCYSCKKKKKTIFLSEIRPKFKDLSGCCYKDQQQTKEVLFSTEFPISWLACKKFQILNIVVDPDLDPHGSNNFHLSGSRLPAKSKKYRSVSLMT